MRYLVQYNTITEADRSAWTDFITNHPDNTVFQSPEMFDFYKKVKYYSPHIFLAKDLNGKVQGVLLAVIIKEYSGWKGHLSARTIVYGGPLVNETNRKIILEELLNALHIKLRKKAIYVQFRNFVEWPGQDREVFESYGYQFHDRLNLLVNTKSRTETERNISKSKLRQIKKGFESGSVIRPPADMEEVQVFYELLKDIYQNRVRKPLPDQTFFEQFYEMSEKGKLGMFRIVLYQDRIIGGVLSPVTKGRNIYEWYVFGLDELYKKNYPSIMATWAPIEYALVNQLDHFDFMGLGTPLKPYGVRDFKLHFGKNTTNPGRFSKINNGLLYTITEMSYNILRIFNKV